MACRRRPVDKLGKSSSGVPGPARGFAESCERPLFSHCTEAPLRRRNSERTWLGGADKGPIAISRSGAELPRVVPGSVRERGVAATASKLALPGTSPKDAVRASLEKPAENHGKILSLIRDDCLWPCSSVAAIQGDAVREDQSLPVLDSAVLSVLEDKACKGATLRFVEESRPEGSSKSTG